MHTFALNAYCDSIVSADSIESLSRTLNDFADQAFLIMGEGSNTIFVEDYPHTLLFNKIKGIEISEDEHAHYICAGAGENWHDLVTFCITRNIGGFENLALIPGTVGAAPIQNIGAYGVEIERFINKVEFYDSATKSIQCLLKDDCEFAYRDSIFKRQPINARIITRVFFTLPKQYRLEKSYGPLSSLSDTATALEVYHAVIDVRKSKLPDPAKLGNAGSFFKNPIISKTHFEQLTEQQQRKTKEENGSASIPHYVVSKSEVKIPAAWLIDQLGFKGKRVGDIACHTEQPLVLVNLGNGKGKDLLALARDIKKAVNNEFGIELENEVRLIGKNGLITL